MTETELYQYKPNDTSYYKAFLYTKPDKLATDIKSIFSGQVDYSLNWLFLSTSGVHGWYSTLDDFEGEDSDQIDADGYFEITALVLKPRTVSVLYGNARFHTDDIPFLREVVSNTIIGIMKSQIENMKV